MNLFDPVVLVMVMWGLTAEGEWTYIGNQYVRQEVMTTRECLEFIDDSKWEKFEENKFYKVELMCYDVKESNH